MANEYPVLWTAEANNNLANIIKYLDAKWGQKEIQLFINKLNKAIALISKKPRLFRLTNSRRNMRKCVLSKHTSIYYQELNSSIYIVALFDNRQDPQKAPK